MSYRRRFGYFLIVAAVPAFLRLLGGGVFALCEKLYRAATSKPRKTPSFDGLHHSAHDTAQHQPHVQATVDVDGRPGDVGSLVGGGGRTGRRSRPDGRGRFIGAVSMMPWRMSSRIAITMSVPM